MHVVREIGRRLGGQRRNLVASLMAGPLAVVMAFVGMSVLVPSPLGANGERTIALYNVHTKQTLRIAYKRNGRYLPAALKKLNWHLRDWRRNEPIKMDPKLIDLVWEIPRAKTYVQYVRTGTSRISSG